MYQIGDQVVYGIHGVCCVVGMDKQVVNRKTVAYLVLEPIGQEGARYMVPMGNEAAMAKLHTVMSLEELEALISSDKIRQDSWVREENLRKQTYRDLISSGDRAEILRMVHTLYVHKQKQLEAGKKFHLADENFLRDAEKLLSSEISVVIDCSFEEARTYLREKLKSE